MNSLKKLLYIANLRLPTERAYGIQIAKMCEALADSGINVGLIFPFRKSPHIKEDIYSYYSIRNNFEAKMIWAPDFYFPGRLDKTSFYIKSFISAVFLSIYALFKKSDFIYSRDELPLFLLSFFKKNLAYEAHRFSKSKGFFCRRFKNKNIKVAVITEHLKEDFVKLGFNPENILVVPDGVDLSKFDLPISQKEAREKVDLPLDKKIIMYTGHLFEWKGTALLLEVARNFKTEEDPLFVFVGGTDYEIDKFRKKAGKLENVLVVGHRPYKEIPIYLKTADVLVLPNSAKEDISNKYTSPLKLFEYMASSRPIVASDLPSVREILSEKNAILVESDTPSALAAGIRKVLDNEAFARSLSEQALKDVHQYTWQKRAKKIINFINS